MYSACNCIACELFITDVCFVMKHGCCSKCVSEISCANGTSVFVSIPLYAQSELLKRFIKKKAATRSRVFFLYNIKFKKNYITGCSKLFISQFQ